MSQRKHLAASGAKLLVFLTATVLMVAVLVETLGDVHPGQTTEYAAYFRDVSGLAPGDEVRVASVTVGRVDAVDVSRSAIVQVRFSVDDSIHVTSSTTATVRYKNLVGDRYLELAPGLHAGMTLHAGDSLPVANTASALDLDNLLNGFKPLFVGLNPTQINALSDQLIQVLQGQQGAVYRLVSTLASFTTSIATREQVVGQVVQNLNVVLGSLDANGSSVGTIIDKLTAVVSKLSSRSPEIITAVQRIGRMATDTAALLAQAQPSINPDILDLRMVAASLDANAATLQSLLTKWPIHYATLLRSGSYGNFLNFFLCAVRLRFTPDGAANPIQTPWMSSQASRCQR